MSPDKMVRMANQIATFFKSQPGDAPDKIADHLRDYWAPDMRQQLQSYVRDGGDGLDALVTEAAQRL